MSSGDVGSDVVMYVGGDGKPAIDVKFQDETVWLMQKQLAKLFESGVPNINEHIGSILYEGELLEDAVIREFRITAADGKNYKTKHYNLDMIISVGYRVKSQVATRFRI